MEKLLWIDLEMTGLDIEKEVIIEVAAIVTDLHFNLLTQYHAVVQQDQKYIDNMDDWNKKHHSESGLIAKIPSGKTSQLVEQELIDLIQKNFPSEPAVIAGNSIFQDRIFINKYWKNLAHRLHYRMLDVTSWKIMMKNKFHIQYDKKGTHRALDDIKESINELKHYVGFIKPQHT
ncbi:MAG: oligoribonuclease [Bdellovibrionales bacterium]